MEGSSVRDGVSGGVTSGGITVVGSDDASSYHVAPRSDNHTAAAGQIVALDLSSTLPMSGGDVQVKKKRGRPRKYGPDGVAAAISPKPISSSAPAHPPVIDFSAPKRGKIRPPGSGIKFNKMSSENSGEFDPCAVGANFMPHMINVNTGEDVTMKVISFSQQGPRAICILSANGVISSVTLRQPDSSGGTLTYEGRFEILSLSGSFMPSDNGATRSRSGGMSVSLASPDGRVIGGGVAGLLVAASPVQIVVGSFLTGNQQHSEQKPRKPKPEFVTTATPLSANPMFSVDMEEAYGSGHGQGHHNSTNSKPNLTAPTSFRPDWSSPQMDLANKPSDGNNNAGLHSD
uniref:AT-hook motif nuclear-localized protein n=1 Tax=Kalanchoe fedtschenkoi TaxID=63787 RepID=A0A7N0V3W5_KALFE